MSVLIVGLFMFFAAHSISIVNVAWRDRVVARIGIFSWQAIYALISIIGLILIMQGYQVARQSPVILYLPPVGLQQLALLLLVFIFPLLLATYIPGRIQTATKDPMSAATGSLADVVLFGSFLDWAVVDRISLRRRNNGPIPMLPASRGNDFIIVFVGLCLYFVFFFWLHEWFIGISPA